VGAAMDHAKRAIDDALDPRNPFVDRTAMELQYKPFTIEAAPDFR
jgi:hypothetical protein